MRNISIFMWKSIQGYRKYYALMLLPPLLGTFYLPLVYYALKLVIDAFSNPAAGPTALLWPVAMYCVINPLFAFVWRVSDLAGQKSVPFVRKAILTNAFERVAAYPFRFFQNQQSGNIVSKIKGLLDGYDEIWAQLHHGLFPNIFEAIVQSASVYMINMPLGLFITLWGLIFLVVGYRMCRKTNSYSNEMNQFKHIAIGKLADAINNIQSVKLLSANAYEKQLLGSFLEKEFIPAQKRFYKYNFRWKVFASGMYSFMLIALLFTMIYLTQQHKVSMGDFAFVFGIAFSFCDVLWRAVDKLQEFSIKIGDLHSSLSLLEAEKSEYHAHPVPLSLQSATIEFSDVSFAYEEGKKVFDHFNLSIRPGEKVGIVGSTGAGKTTLINLLLKLVTPNLGQILIGGQDITDADPENVRKLLALIPQDISLFHRSLMDNIRYGRPEATDEEVIEVSKLANVHSFVSTMPQGYHTLVGERGVKLSGGQRQRIAIARAILKRAPILVLDEATSALDSITEQEVHQSLETALQGKTVLAIAHRLSTLRDMDRIIVLDQGKIAEQGTLSELLAIDKGLFKKIWQTQADGMIP